MQVHIPSDIKQVYQTRQAENQARLDRYRQDFLARDPELRALERSYREAGASYLLKSLQGGAELEAARAKLAQLQTQLGQAYQAKEARLLAPEDLYTCPLCQDTGLYQGQLCSCALEIRNQLERQKGISFPPPPEASLAHFDLDLFSPQLDPQIYKGQASPRQVAENLYQRSLEILANFPHSDRNFYFFGKPGTGKTYLAAALANGLRAQGYSVAFIRSMAFVDLTAQVRVLDRSFSADRTEKQVAHERLQFLRQAQVLVLDDLGSEAGNDASYNDLIALLDGRVQNPEQMTLLTGNLPPLDFSRRYDERLGSRLLGAFLAFPLEGPDLRMELARRTQKGTPRRDQNGLPRQDQNELQRRAQMEASRQDQNGLPRRTQKGAKSGL